MLCNFVACQYNWEAEWPCWWH